MITFVVEVDVDGGGKNTHVAALADALAAAISQRVVAVTVPESEAPWRVTDVRHHIRERVL